MTVKRVILVSLVLIGLCLVGFLLVAIATTGGNHPKVGTFVSVEPTFATSSAKKSTVSLEQQNAVKSAQNYLENMGFSRQGLIDQLKFDKYNAKTATVAVDSLHVDWNAQAAIVAQSYLDNQSFSPGGLIAQLEYDGFTKMQATYGVKRVGL